MNLQEDDKEFVKMVIRIDESVARVFFSKKVVIVEGDSEEVAWKETIDRLEPYNKNNILSNVQMVKARGKSSIISLCKYLSAMGVNFFVIHDRDAGKPKAEEVNDKILDILGSEDYRAMLKESIEGALEYAEPSSEKPFHVYNNSLGWGDDFSGIPEQWRLAFYKSVQEFFH